MEFFRSFKLAGEVMLLTFSRFFIYSMFFFAVQGLAAQSLELPQDINTAEEEAISWLADRIVPNQDIPDPTALRRRLIQSYVIDPQNPAYPWIYHRSYIYDDALAVITFTILEDYQKAELILSALYRNLQPDGAMFFAYNTRNDWPYMDYPQGGQIRSGALAWVGYAAVFYLEQRLEEDPWFLEDDLLAKDILDLAQKIGNYLLNRQIQDPADGRFGMVTGGYGSHQLGLEDETIQEEFIPVEITWVSMEHNVDIYFLFRDLGLLTGEEKWTQAAERLAQGLMSLWNPRAKQFNRGYRPETGLDGSLPLDGASWGFLFLHARGDMRKQRRSLQNIDEVFLSTGDQFRGYRPYGNEPVYEQSRINAWYFPSNPQTQWTDLDFVWTEGSLGVAAAYARGAMEEQAIEILRDTIPLIYQGGVRYASNVVDYQFGNDPSVASTTWFILVAEILKGNPHAQDFWGNDEL
jgi:hypothetical protein